MIGRFSNRVKKSMCPSCQSPPILESCPYFSSNTPRCSCLLLLSSTAACFSKNTIIAILLFLIGLVVFSCGIIFSVWYVKRRRALAAAGQAQDPAGAAAAAGAGPAAQWTRHRAAGAGATPCRSCGQRWRPAGSTVSCLQQRHQMGRSKLS